MHGRRGLLCLALAAPAAALRTAAGRGAAAGAADADAEYYWPSGHGRIGDYGNSPYAGPKDLQASFAWSWHHPQGRFHTLPYGTAIDGQKNIYLTTDTSIWKISPNGTTLWSFYPKPKGTIFSAGSLHDGKIYFTTLNGWAWAVNMETGKAAWSRRVCNKTNTDNSFTSAHEGVVIAAMDHGGQERPFNTMVRAFNATDGSDLWQYQSAAGLWNFQALFPNDGTVVWQDFEGRGYRNRLSDGSLIWMAGGEHHSWTDGTPLLSNGTFYTVTGWMNRHESDQDNAPGRLRAYRLSDGQNLWDRAVPMPPNNAPAIGRLPGQPGLSIVQPAGYQGVRGGSTAIYAYDAFRGKRIWNFAGPAQKHDRQAGEVQGMLERIMAGASAGYVTNPWSAAVVDARGTVYVGHEDGLIFALHDANGDGKLEGDEVSTFDSGAAFVGSSSPAMAPGMMAIASCDTLYVFNADV